jgi:hypothetical protein
MYLPATGRTTWSSAWWTTNVGTRTVGRPTVANHVAAVVLFGTPSNEFLRDAGAPPITIGPLYAAKTSQLCAPDDSICNGAPPGPPSIAHTLYPANGLVGQGADFAASHL